MPVRDILIAVSLLAIVLLIAFVADAMGSEYYLFLGSGRRFRRGLMPPPTSAWHILILVVVPVSVFFLSRRYAAIMVAVLPLLALIGLPAGTLFFGWTPGIAHYLLFLALAGLAIFVWSNDHLHHD